MEAYQAYYNTNESKGSNAAQVLQPNNVKEDSPYPLTEVQSPKQLKEHLQDVRNENAKAHSADNQSTGKEEDGEKKQDPKVINNVVHIDQKGANINITNINNHQTFVIYANR